MKERKERGNEWNGREKKIKVRKNKKRKRERERHTPVANNLFKLFLNLQQTKKNKLSYN